MGGYVGGWVGGWLGGWVVGWVGGRTYVRRTKCVNNNWWRAGCFNTFMIVALITNI